MNEEAIQYSYELFKNDGYDGTIDDYKSLINSNNEALNYSYNLFSKDGYNGSEDDFKSLMGIGQTPEAPKGDAAEVSGESASTSADTISSSDSEKSNEKPLNPLAATMFPELYKEYRELEKKVSESPIMLMEKETNRLEEIEEIFNTQPVKKSYKRIVDEEIAELDKQQDELVSKYNDIAQRTGGDLEQMLQSDGVYEDIIKRKKMLNESKALDEGILTEISKDTNSDQHDFLGKVGRVFGINAGASQEADQVLDLNPEIEEQILLNLDGNQKLKEKIAKGYATLNEKENLINNAKVQVVKRAANRIKGQVQDIMSSSEDPAIKQEKLEALDEEYNTLLGQVGIDQITGILKNNFKKTDESQEFDELVSSDGYLASTGDATSSFLEGVIQTGFKGTVGFTSDVMSGFGDTFTDQEGYSVFDAFGDTVNQLANYNYLPSSRKVDTQIVDAEGDLNVNYKTVTKTIAQVLPFTLAIVNDVKKGKVSNIEASMGRLLNPTKSQSVRNQLNMIDSAYRHTLSDNLNMAEELGLNDNDGRIFANTLSLAEGMAEMIMPDTKFFKTTAGDALLQTFKGDLKSAATSQAKKQVVTNFVKNMALELGEEEVVLATEDLLKFSMVVGHENSEFFDMKRQKELAMSTVILSGTLGGANVKRDYQGNVVETYKEISKNINDVTESLQQELSSGVHSPEVEAEITKSIDWANHMNKAITTAPENVTGEQVDLLMQKQSIIEEMKNVDDAFHPQYKAKIEAINQKINPTNETGEKKTTGDTTVGTTENVESGKENAEAKSIPTESKEEVKTEKTTRQIEDEALKELTDNFTQEQLAETVEELGLNNHKGNGYSFEASVENIQKVADKLGYELKATRGEVKQLDVEEREIFKKGAEAFRGAKFYKNPSEAMSKLQSDPTGLLKFAWDGAMETMATTIEATGKIDTAIRNGVAQLKQSDWYKSLSADGKKKAIEIFEKDSRKAFQPIADSFVKVKKTPVKTQVRKATGQTDTSNKVVTTEAKALKEKLKNLEKGSKLGAKAIMQAKKDAIKAINEAVKPYKKDKELLGKAYSTAMSAVNQYNGTNWDKVEGAIDKLTQKLDEAVFNKGVKKAIKKAKSNAKRTSVAGQTINSILRYDPSWITDSKDLNKYKEILDKFNTGENFNLKEAQDFFNEIHEKYFDKIPEKKLRENRPANYNEKKELVDNLAYIKKADKKMLTPEEVQMLNDFLKIPLEYFDTLSDTKVRELNRALNKFNQSGIIPSKVLFDHVRNEVGQSTANELLSGLGDNILRVRSNALEAVKRLFTGGKNKISSADAIDKVNNRMLHHIDNVITNFKGYKLYTKVIHPITSKITKAENETSQVESNLINLIRKAKISSEGSRFSRLKPSILKGLKIKDILRYETELSIKTQLYFRQKEFEANKEYSNVTKGVAKVYGVDSHIEAMNNPNLSTNYKNDDVDIEAVNSVYNKYLDSDGKFDLAKLEESFTKEEKALVEYMESVISDMTSKSMFLNTHVRGESLTMLNNYFPRKSAMNNSTDSESLDMAIARMTSQVGVKDSSSNERAATKAEPLDFNTFNNFLRYVKGSNLEYNVLPEIKKANATNKILIKHGGEAKKLGDILSETVKNVITAKGKTPFSKDTKLERAFRVFQKNTFNKLLIDPFRFTVDLATNQGITALANAYRYGRIRKANKSINKSLRNNIAKDFGSIHYERLSKFMSVLGDSSIDYKQTALGALAKGRFGTTAETIRGNALELIQKNVLSDVADIAAVRYYQVVDSIAAPLWTTEVFENFKKSTGIEITSENYASLKETHKKKFEEAIAKADKEVSNVFNTISTSEQKLNIQLQDSNSIKKMVDSFMKSFAFNENSTLWDSIISLGSMGKKGNMTVEEATRNFFILNTRSIAYAFLTQVMLKYVQMALFDEDEEEGLEEKAAGRAVAQHASLLVLGNYGNLVNMIANMVFVTGQEIYAASEGEKFNRYENSLLYSMSDRGKPSSYAKSFGAGGETFSTLVLQPLEIASELGVKYAKNGEWTEEDIINAKVAGYSLNLLSQLTGLSTYRLGKITDNQLKASIND